MKRQIRQHVLTSLQGMSEVDYHERSAQLHQQLLQSFSFTKDHLIGCTISRFPEPDTRALIEYFWQHSIPVAAPVSHPLTKEMTFYQIYSWGDVTEGYKGIWEPRVEPSRNVSNDQFTHILVPGVVFDRQGYRIGFGGGFYDRFLTNCTAETISLVFKEQLLSHQQVEAHDIPVKWLVTEHELIKV